MIDPLQLLFVGWVVIVAAVLIPCLRDGPLLDRDDE
jgi:hypothetical protein